MVFRFTRVAALSNGNAYIAADDEQQDDYAPFSRIYRFESENWSYFDLDFYVFSLAQVYDEGAPVSAVALGLNGEVEFLGSDTPRENIAGGADGTGLRPGRFTQIREIADTLYAVGEGGRNFRRIGPAQWEVMDSLLLQQPMSEDWDREFFPPEVYDAPNDPKNYGRGRRKSAYLLQHQDVSDRHTKKLLEVYHDQTLWAINGENAQDIYIGGIRNSIRVWLPEQARFSEPLMGAALNEDGESSVLDIGKGLQNMIYGCGGGGLLIEGGRDGFESAINLRGTGHFAAMTLFKSGQYLIDQLGKRGLWQFDGYRLSLVDTGLDPEPGPLMSISSSDDCMWAVGSKEIIRFDGVTWERMPLPA